MLVKTYKPIISKHDIELVLASDDFGYSDETASELAEEREKYRKMSLKRTGLAFFIGIGLLSCGLLFRLMFSGNWIVNFMIIAGAMSMAMAPFVYIAFLALSKTKVSQDDPVKVYRSFLNELLCEEFPDHTRAYQLVAPSVLNNISVKEIPDAYEQVKQDILSIVKSLETATCTNCGKEEGGLWAGKWKLPPEYLQNKKYHLRCGNCNTLYCETCFIEIPPSGNFYKRRNCPNCGKQLEEQNIYVFLSNPEIHLGTAIGEISVEYEMNKQVVQLHAEVNIGVFLKKPVTSSDPNLFGTENDYVELGDRGKAICHFHNTAVKNGDKWYLLSALPNG